MDIWVALFRLVHTFAGVLWVGTAFFMVLFLEPVVAQAGADGGKFMQRLMMTRLSVTLALASAFVLVSGIVMYWSASRGLQASWFGTRAGIALTVGAIAGILAFAIGLVVMAPASGRIASIQKEIQAAGKPPSPAQLAAIGAQQKTISIGSRWEALLMAVALIGMALG